MADIVFLRFTWRSDVVGLFKLILTIERLCFVVITIIAAVTNDEWCSATPHFSHAELLGYRPELLPCERKSCIFSCGAYWIFSLFEHCLNVEFNQLEVKMQEVTGGSTARTVSPCTIRSCSMGPAGLAVKTAGFARGERGFDSHRSHARRGVTTVAPWGRA